MKGEPYIRKKGKKYIIEQKIDNKTKYLKTLPNAKDLLEMLSLDAKEEIASQNDTKVTNEPVQKVAQSSLSEQDKQDENKTLKEKPGKKPTKEEEERILIEEAKKVLKGLNLFD